MGDVTSDTLYRKHAQANAEPTASNTETNSELLTTAVCQTSAVVDPSQTHHQSQPQCRGSHHSCLVYRAGASSSQRDLAADEDLPEMTLIVNVQSADTWTAERRESLTAPRKTTPVNFSACSCSEAARHRRLVPLP